MQLKSLSIALFSFLLASNANAIEVKFKPYIGVDFSASQVNSQDILGIANEDLTVGAVGLKFGADITDFFGVEGRFGMGILNDDVKQESFFEREKTTLRLDSYLAAFGKLQTPEYHGFRLKGLAGVSYLDMSAKDVYHDKITTLTTTTRDNAYKTSFAYGAGVSYSFTDKISTDLEYLKLHEDMDTLNLGLTYHF